MRAPPSSERYPSSNSSGSFRVLVHLVRLLAAATIAGAVLIVLVTQRCVRHCCLAV